MQANDLAQNVSMALERRLRIIQLDEFIVSKLTISTHIWTNKKRNIEYDLSKIQTKPKAVVMAVSREYGLDLLQIYKNSINKNKIKVFLDELRRKYWTDDILLIMDNLAVHRNGEVKRLMD